MSKKVTKIISVILSVCLLSALCGCSLTSFTVDELKTLYPKAVENSLKEELYYWKETVNNNKDSLYRTCNVYAEIDKQYNVIRNEDGSLSNMKIDVTASNNSKNTYKALCGKSQSSSSEETKNYLFETSYNDDGEEVSKAKTEISPQNYVKSDAFADNYSLASVLSELSVLTVEDMNFDFDKSKLEHKGNVVKISFKVKDEYVSKYKEEFNKNSVFENSNYVTLEISYNRISSLVIYQEEKLSEKVSADKEVYKLEISYFGPIVNIPSYDSDEWSEV